MSGSKLFIHQTQVLKENQKNFKGCSLEQQIMSCLKKYKPSVK